MFLERKIPLYGRTVCVSGCPCMCLNVSVLVCLGICLFFALVIVWICVGVCLLVFVCTEKCVCVCVYLWLCMCVCACVRMHDQHVMRTHPEGSCCLCAEPRSDHWIPPAAPSACRSPRSGHVTQPATNHIKAFKRQIRSQHFRNQSNDSVSATNHFAPV